MSAFVRDETEVLSRVDRARADPMKSGGVHYTPPELAEFMARRAWSTLGAPLRARVLDPACGDGALLAAVVACAPPGTSLEIVGFDTDGASLESAHQRLLGVGARPGDVKLRHADFLDWIQPQNGGRATLFDAPALAPAVGSFDLVIANPPYVRTQVLGAERAQQLARAFGISGRVDLYHAFLLGMSLSLRSGGALGLLCSNRFLTTRTGRGLREHLASSYDLQHIYDLGDSRLFAAAVLPAVVIAQRTDLGSETCGFTSVYEIRDSQSFSSEPIECDSVVRMLSEEEDNDVLACVDGTSYRISRGVLPNLRSADSPWVVSPSGVLVEIEARTHSHFGDLGKIRVGVKTTADSVFIREDWADIEPDLRPEPELVLPLLTHHVAARWRTTGAARRILYPYDLTKTKRTPLDLSDWPRAAAYFESHRGRLESRRYVVDGGRYWWEIWVPQRPSAWSGPKIVFPDISEDPRFFIDWSGALVNGDCYWMPFAPEHQHLAYLTIAVGNSSLGTHFYDGACGNKLYAGRRRYITQYVERFPLPDPESSIAHEIAGIVDRLCRSRLTPAEVLESEAEVDRLVWRSFGVKEPPG